MMFAAILYYSIKVDASNTIFLQIQVIKQCIDPTQNMITISNKDTSNKNIAYSRFMITTKITLKDKEKN